MTGNENERTPSMWDADRYLRFADERARPFFDLVERIDHPAPKRVVDLGCGTGRLTATLVERWPEALIVGVDSSQEMIARALGLAVPGRLEFVLDDVAQWQGDEPYDVILSNACFHWIPDHRRLLADLVPQLALGGVLAFQVPDNFSAPSHVLVREVVESPAWRDRLGDLRRAAVETPEWYVDVLESLGLEAEAWQTTYTHTLEGDNPVLEWLSGTTLCPVSARLDDEERQQFVDQLAPLLREAYPSGPEGTSFPFRRLFVIASRSD